jgi:DNA-binding NarL/FixJ family response regulator
MPPTFLNEFRADRSHFLRVATTLRAAIAIVRTERFECILVDRDLEDGDGLVLAPTIRRIQPTARSILFTQQVQWATIEAARDLGYSEVIKKSHLEEVLVERIATLLLNSGEHEMKVEHSKSRIHLLSLREREILNDIATGATTAEIAAKRHNSQATIKSHLTSIYRKLEVRNRTEAIAQLPRN